ncbi:TlyA family RNA methyltransferase [Kiritimatiella glycovorans]|uniref:16S/23S rRNA (Cytidine-2'-O)-methyltransferase TlyA n=1 Tax=Kiritimatiella glycovorans TaxID=1307763 RepID=A0A0G3EH19_9BACT|nr:TlyA family RNA methyltransferase [Kiritimatiella glycovorans]AKJ64105.1 16S/23S rRNA (cytidine-2'-O)-methyltransferase TlyA [Kiritimatiella glycovorans]
MKKPRLDQLLVERGLAQSRERARRLIIAGEVRVGGVPVTKPGRPVMPDAEIEVAARERYVGRGAYKLEHALHAFDLEVTDRTALDVGASTGGFTDCLLQHGARRVYAVDVGYGQLDYRLRQDPRVVVMERVHARYLQPDALPERVGFICVDVSFISLTLILPAVIPLASPGTWMVTLIKPQFEARRGQVARGGVVRDESVRKDTIERVRRFGQDQPGCRWIDCVPSPVRGPAGNVEYLALWTLEGDHAQDTTAKGGGDEA